LWPIDHLYRLLDVLFKIEAEPFKTYRGEHCGGYFLFLTRTLLDSAIISPLFVAVAVLTSKRSTKSLRYQSFFHRFGAPGRKRFSKRQSLHKFMNHICFRSGKIATPLFSL
jgi:hypothetical protein